MPTRPKLTRDEVIAKAAEFAKLQTRSTFTGRRHVRDALVVYFEVKSSETKACVEVHIDSETGDVYSCSIGAVSILHAYSPVSRPRKAKPN